MKPVNIQNTTPHASKEKGYVLLGFDKVRIDAVSAQAVHTNEVIVVAEPPR